MYQPLPTFPPLNAPIGWWRTFCRLRAGDANAGIKEIVTVANRESGLRPRDWLRFTIAADVSLSMPVAGGASALKNRHPDSWKLAGESVAAADKIKDTLATVYGRTPYFRLLEEEMELPATPGLPASVLNWRMFECAAEVLGVSDVSLWECLPTFPSADYVDPEPQDSLSVVDAIFRKGPDAIFSLLPTF